MALANFYILPLNTAAVYKNVLISVALLFHSFSSFCQAVTSCLPFPQPRTSLPRWLSKSLLASSFSRLPVSLLPSHDQRLHRPASSTLFTAPVYQRRLLVEPASGSRAQATAHLSAQCTPASRVDTAVIALAEAYVKSILTSHGSLWTSRRLTRSV